MKNKHYNHHDVPIKRRLEQYDGDYEIKFLSFIRYASIVVSFDAYCECKKCFGDDKKIRNWKKHRKHQYKE